MSGRLLSALLMVVVLGAGVRDVPGLFAAWCVGAALSMLAGHGVDALLLALRLVRVGWRV